MEKKNKTHTKVGDMLLQINKSFSNGETQMGLIILTKV